MIKLLCVLLTFSSLPFAFANGGAASFEEDLYKDKVETKSSTYERSEQTPQKMEAKPQKRITVERFEETVTKPVDKKDESKRP